MRVGDVVRIRTGAFANFTGTVKEIDTSRLSLVVAVEIFGRRIPVEVPLTDVETAENEPPRRSDFMNPN